MRGRGRESLSLESKALLAPSKAALSVVTLPDNARTALSKCGLASANSFAVCEGSTEPSRTGAHNVW